MVPQMKLITIVDKITKSIDDQRCSVSTLSTDIKNLGEFIETLQPKVAQCVLPILVSPFLAIHAKRDMFNRFNEDDKLRLLNILKDILSRTKLDNEHAFSLLYDFLLVHIYDTKSSGPISDLSEEMKEAILDTISALFTSMSWDLYLVIYTVKYTPQLCLLVHLCVNMTQKEKSRTLRLKSIACIMQAAKVDDASDMDDVVLMSQVATVFRPFLPGISSCLIVACVDDQKCGHRIVASCTKAWGRLVSALMRDYNAIDRIVPHLEDVFCFQDLQVNTDNEEKNKHDEKLAVCADLLTRLAGYDHSKVRCELAFACTLLVKTCFTTLPRTTTKIIEILIILSQDEDKDTCNMAQDTLLIVNENIKDNYLMQITGVLDNLQESFHKHLTQLPRVFNGLDTHAQIVTLNLVNGYLKLFASSSKLKNVLLTQINLSRLMGSLLHVAEIEKSNVSLLEEYAIHDWEVSPDTRTPWKTFKFSDKTIQTKLETTCHLLVQDTIVDIVLDYLLEVFHNECYQRAEAILLMNEVMSVESELIDFDKAKNIIDTYLDPKYWQLALIVDGKTVLKDVQNNIIQLCLQLEGIGKIALAIGDKFKELLLKVLYFVLEKAGNGHPLLRAAGLSSIANIAKACGYKTITTLINENTDYFSYNVINKLRRVEENESVLTVLTVVMNYSNMDVLHSISDIVEGVLLQSCDKYQDKNAHLYLTVFVAFIKSMHKWLNVEVTVEPMVTKEQKEKQLKLLHEASLHELNQTDFSDDKTMEGKTIEEMYHEDLDDARTELENEDNDDPEISEFKKPEPPRHIKLIVSILERSVNFLPGKETNQKIQVLLLLNTGVEILKDYEDELLPIVHKIWSPLVNRFKEFDAPLIINLSFQLLITLGRLSRDFIRMRTIKEVLPSIDTVLVKQSKESYLKDRGSAYRYTQGYKMQLTLLQGLARLAYDLDLGDKVTDISNGVALYLCCKQPKPLQKPAIDFFKTILEFDPSLGHKLYKDLETKYRNQADWNKNLDILQSVVMLHLLKNDKFYS